MRNIEEIHVTKRAILLTGTPCVGKTSVARLLVKKLDASYVNLTELATSENLVLGKDTERKSLIVDENRMKKRISQIIEACPAEDIVIDGHYAVSVVPKDSASFVFVLRRDPVELRKLMEQSGFSNRKLWENLASEILDVCLVEALGAYGKDKICELDVSWKTVEECVSLILEALNDSKKCRVGVVDWLGKLENEGRLAEFLKI